MNIYNELPAEVSPLYGKYTDAKRMDPDKVSLSTISNSKLPDFLSKRVEEVKKENGLIQVGTNIISTNLSDELKSKGVIVSSIDDALKQHQELIEKTNLNPNVFKPISGNGSYGTMDVNTMAPIRSNNPKTFQANKIPHIIFDGLL